MTRIIIINLFVVFAAIELVSQGVGIYFSAQSKTLKANPRFYYEPSPNPRLVYGLKPNVSLTVGDHVLRTNQFGVRDDHDDRGENKNRIAVVGDSNTFGTDLTQAATIPAQLQKFIDATGKETKVINGGVPGYALREVAARLDELLPIYQPQTVVYLLNPNDFALRDTAQEGADNGLYRTFHMPFFKSRWLARKLIYRLHKGRELVSVPWYRWMFESTKSVNLPYLASMATACRASGARFIVVILPSKFAYSSAGYQLSAMNAEISDYLKKIAVLSYDVSEQFPANDTLLDGTDHFTVPGARVMAQFLAQRLHDNGKSLSRK